MKKQKAFDSLKGFLKFWTILGIIPLELQNPYKRFLYKIYVISVYFLVFIFFPFHIVWFLVEQTTLKEIMESIVLAITIINVTVKASVLKVNLSGFFRIQVLIEKLEDKAIKDDDFQEYMEYFQIKTKKHIKIYTIFYGSVVVLSIFGLIFSGKRILLIPGVFPFDHNQNLAIWISCVIYQCVCYGVVVMASMSFDMYPGILIFLLDQHFKYNSLKVSKIGYGQISKKTYMTDLIKRIKYHKDILEYFLIVRKVISPSMFALFLVTTFNFVVCLCMIMFFSEDLYSKMHYFAIMNCIFMEIGLTCYFGSELESSLYNFTNEIYSCNWYERDAHFKKIIILFLQFSLRDFPLLAGGMIPISIVTCMKIFKSTFSMFTLLNGLRVKYT